MTNEKALSYWQTFLKEIDELKHRYPKIMKEWKKQEQATEIAIEILKKQMPKKVEKIKLRENELGTPYYCPECEADITPVEFFRTDGNRPNEMVSYCWKCGQAIDWSE